VSKRLNTSISNGNRFFFKIYPPCAFLITNILKYVIVHIVHYISLGGVLDCCKLNIHTLQALVSVDGYELGGHSDF
jgi:tartrate dehydratase beta subunit/fumarate hydratase class I family protein